MGFEMYTDTNEVEGALSGSMGPFGNPEGGREDFKGTVGTWDSLKHFIEFDPRVYGNGIGLSKNDLSARVIVGAKGSGKTLYLRRLRAAALDNESVLSQDIAQGPPSTASIVDFSSQFNADNLTEAWKLLWLCAIRKWLLCFMLRDKTCSDYISPADRETLESYGRELWTKSPRTSRSIYAMATELLDKSSTAHKFQSIVRDPIWEDLSNDMAEILKHCPPIFLFLDAIDDEFAHAPLYWMRCQKGLFYQVMSMLREHRFGGRLHIVITIRDLVYASVLQSEHGSRYRGDSHIRILNWNFSSMSHLLKAKIERLGPTYLIKNVDSPGVGDWLGLDRIESGRSPSAESAVKYLLRHTRMLPRDLISTGNKLCDLVARANSEALAAVEVDALRLAISNSAREVGAEQLRICGNQIMSNKIAYQSTGGKRKNEYYNGEDEYRSGIDMTIRELIRETIDTDRPTPSDIAALRRKAREELGELVDLPSVLWQNRLIGFCRKKNDHGNEVFFNDDYFDDFGLPENVNSYAFHSTMIDSLGLTPKGEAVLGYCC